MSPKPTWITQQHLRSCQEPPSLGSREGSPCAEASATEAGLQQSRFEYPNPCLGVGDLHSLAQK